MATTTEMIAATGVDVCTAQDFDIDIPVLSGIQRQGDVLVRPADVAAATPVGATGTPVVRGESGGNTHAIYAADGPVFCDVSVPSARDLRVAVLTVPEGSTAYLGHPEHGYQGIAPGSYEIRRQREMAEEIRMVADQMWPELSDADSPAVRDALTHRCGICHAEPGLLCRNTTVVGTLAAHTPLPGGRLVHIERATR